MVLSPLTCVPLMMTVCAGRLTPQARVAVEMRTCSEGGEGGWRRRKTWRRRVGEEEGGA